MSQITLPSPLTGLNEQQTKAVLQMNGPVLILAGAGSGKTRALTHRIAHLIQQGVPAWQILAVTFTNKAAKEMKERVRNLLQITEGEDLAAYGTGEGRLPTMGTFHSICMRILRRDIEQLGRDKKFTIYDDDDQEKVVKRILKEKNIEENELKPRAALSFIGRFKSEAIPPSEAQSQATSDRMRRVIEVYAAYEKALRESNALDFDDLILETVRLFHECPDVLARYQETWRYLHVDEYQDTNHAQYLFISLLAKKYRNLCVIGDPDQSIYGFRGADIRNILEFEKEYPDAVRIKLEQNYRSVQPILTAADCVIAANPQRPDKQMWTERKDGPRVIVHEVRDERREAEEVIRAIDQRRSDGIPLREQVILYRTHAQSRLFEEACMRSGIPYRLLGGTKFYGRKEVKDVLAYLQLLINPYDTVSLLRIINVPARKIGDKTIQRIHDYATAHHLPLWDALRYIEHVEELDSGVRGRIAHFTQLIERFRERSQQDVVSAVAQALIEDIGMEKYLRDGTEEGDDRWGNIQELLTVTHKYDALEPTLSLTSFLEEVSLVSEVDKLTDGQSDALTLMTLHLCKGLEFESVTIVGCEEGLFPHGSSLFSKEQLEEERRLMYVGMTRAKTHLRMLFAQSRFLWGDRKANAPSRFLDDLPDAVIERRSDDVLSAFAWASKRGFEISEGERLSNTPQSAMQTDVSLEFKSDFADADLNQLPVEEGSRIEHPSFGKGTVLARRGDVVDIQFDSGKKKTFALSIAPLRVL